VREVIVATTLLEPSEAPADEIADLFRARWHAEVYQPEYLSSARLYQRAA
jgi:hypothetical protein